MRSIHPTQLLLVLALSGGFSLPGLASAELTEHEVLCLKQGEILLQTVKDGKPGGAARVTALFYATSQAVWDVIGYCKNEYIYLRGLKFCEMVEGDQFQMTKHHRLRNSWFLPTLDIVVKAHRNSDGLGQASLVSGDLKALEARWQLVPLAGESAVIVTHQIRVQPKIPVPKWLVRRSLKRDLPDMMACVRGLARASGGAGHIEADLLRCPGKANMEADAVLAGEAK